MIEDDALPRDFLFNAPVWALRRVVLRHQP
jgi:hypothetical protein